jgi:kinesin family protein 4/21/27
MNPVVTLQLIGLTEVEVHSAEEIMRYLMEGSQGRTVGATAMNNQSSRSHAIFTIHIERKNKNDR